jgi:hypothetical protein
MHRLLLSLVATALLTGLAATSEVSDSAGPQRSTRLMDLDPFESPEAFSKLADIYLETDAVDTENSTAGTSGDEESEAGKESAVDQEREPQPSPRAAPPSTGADREAQPAGADGNAEEAEEEQPPTANPAPVTHIPLAPPRKLTPQMQQLRDRVRDTLRRHQAADYNVYSSTATDVMYYCLAFGRQAAVRTRNSPRPVSAIGCLCYNYSFQGHRPLMVIDDRPAARIGFGRQAYPSQMLAVLAEARVSAQYPIRVGKAQATVADFVEYEKWSCREANDMALKLVGLAHYVGTDQSWENRDGEQWSLGRVIEAELDKPITAASYGGVHRLTGLSCAVQRRVRDGLPIDGPYLRARHYVDVFHDHALRIQNADGSWHPRMLRVRGVSRDAIGNLRSTGMILAWLARSLPAEELDDIRVKRSVDYVTNLVGSRRFSSDSPNLPAGEIAAVMHAVHALRIYDERVFRPADPPPPAPRTVASAAASRDAR